MMSKVHWAVFSSEHEVSQQMTIEPARARKNGTRWFSAPDATMHARSVKIITRGKGKNAKRVRRISYK